MNKVAHYLQEHLLGEVTDSPPVRKFFARDGSFLEINPAIIVYPRTEDDIRKTASFCWQLSERGQLMPITSRGSGSNTTGAAIGRGLILVFPAHLNRLIDLDIKNRLIRVEPGLNYGTLEQTLFTHGLFFPPCAANGFSTIGGSLSANTAGQKSIKYGVTLDYVQSLRVVLANGEVIETRPLDKKALSRKMGLTTFEGAIYRALDKLLEENAKIIEESGQKFAASRNSCGYNIFDIRTGEWFDLTPLLVGSQGTLGIITEAELSVAPHNAETILVLASLPNLGSLAKVLSAILKLEPSRFDFVNQATVEQVGQINPNQLAGYLPDAAGQFHLLVEFDDFKSTEQSGKAKSLAKAVRKASGTSQTYKDQTDQVKAQKVPGSVATILNFGRGPAWAVPVAEAICLPTDKIVDCLSFAYQLFGEIDLPPVAWGQIGDGLIGFWPRLDLSKTGDRQKLFKIADTLYAKVVELGGSISGSAGDGRVRAPYIKLQYGEQLKAVMDAVKQIFDPHGILNPDVKSASLEDIKGAIASEPRANPYLPYLPLK